MLNLYSVAISFDEEEFFILFLLLKVELHELFLFAVIRDCPNKYDC